MVRIVVCGMSSRYVPSTYYTRAIDRLGRGRGPIQCTQPVPSAYNPAAPFLFVTRAPTQRYAQASGASRSHDLLSAARHTSPAAALLHNTCHMLAPHCTATHRECMECPDMQPTFSRRTSNWNGARANLDSLHCCTQVRIHCGVVESCDRPRHRHSVL